MYNQLESNNSYLGFTNGKSPMQAAKIQDALDKKYRYDSSIIMTRKDAMLYYLRRGEKVFFMEREQKNGKTKKEYGMHVEGSNLYSIITKTEYDFANYLVENDLVSEESVNFYIEKENAEKAAKEQAEREAKEKVIREKEEKERERKEFRKWLENTTMNYQCSTWMGIQEQIYLSIYGEFPRPERAYELLVCIENIDKPLCREELKSRLHRDNTASRKTFYHVTGLRLPDTNKETMEFLDHVTVADFTGTIPFMPRKKKEVQEEVFYILSHNEYDDGFTYKKVMGEKVTKYGLDMFIHNNGNSYLLSSAECGVRIAHGNSKTELMQKLKEVVDRMGIDSIKSQVKQVCDRYGKSPYYN